MDERFFATAVVALILALFFGAGSSRPGSHADPVQSVRAAPAQAAPPKTPGAETAVSRSAPATRVAATPKT